MDLDGRGRPEERAREAGLPQAGMAAVSRGRRSRPTGTGGLAPGAAGEGGGAVGDQSGRAPNA
eukprot:2116665-Lingulodinium_polyedra.AAC.1